MMRSAFFVTYQVPRERSSGCPSGQEVLAQNLNRNWKAATEMCAAAGMGVRELRGTLIVPKCTQIVSADFVKLLRDMVGTWGLEPQTSTVSR
jgi:hypothetical protein